MQITSRFTVAIQCLLCIAHYNGKKKMTSAVLSRSTGADAAIIRRLLGQLQVAGYITAKPGVGGAYPARDLAVGNNIHAVLDEHLWDIQQAMYDKMKSINISKFQKEPRGFRSSLTSIL